MAEAPAPQRQPRWIKVPCDEVSTELGRHIIAGGSRSNWADYGRYLALRELLMTTEGAIVRLGAREAGALARHLGFSGAKALRSWLDMLAECGAISAADWAEGAVCVPDVSAQRDAYVRKCRVVSRNREGRGGP